MPFYSYQYEEYHFVFNLLAGVRKEKPALKCLFCGSSEIEKAWRFFKINFRGKIDLFCLNYQKNSCANCGRN